MVNLTMIKITGIISKFIKENNYNSLVRHHI